MKTFISLLFFIGFTSNSNVKKRILSYPVIICGADLIVEGEISEVSLIDNEYDFKIIEFIKGNAKQEISINMWEEWTCDMRIKRPKKGQRLILFLTKSDNGKFHIINGSTGELFINEKEAIETFMKSDFSILSEFKSGIKMFLNAYKYNGDLYSKFGSKSYFEKLIDQSEINKMMNENGFFKTMVLQIEHNLEK